jgi:hypothetical protein
MMKRSYRQHWESVFDTKAEDQVNWFQPYPKTSLAFVDLFHLPLDANIIDIGGGYQSFRRCTIGQRIQERLVLDISATAIERVKQRLGEKASKVHWVISDITAFEPLVQFDFWHGRAAFHFLTTEDNIYK